MSNAKTTLISAAAWCVAPLKRGRIAIVVAVALGLFGHGAKAADSLTTNDFAHAIKLQVNGYTGSETLANFPVLVRVSESGIPGFRFADMSAKNTNGKALGYDLAFFAENGTRLEIDKDTWDIDKTVGTTGEMLVWVKLPTMTQGTKFYMCYNVADGVMVTNDTNPWSEYVGVWHLNETNNASAYGTYPNSTATAGIDGQKARRSIANESGVIGKSVRIAKKEANWMNANGNQILYGGVFVRDSGDNAPLDLGSSFTISGWFKYDDTKMYRYDKVFFKRTRAQNDTGETGSFAIQMNSWDSKSGKVSIRGSGNESSGDTDLKPIMFNKWAYIAFSYNGANNKCTVYTNGFECSKVTFSAIVDNNQPLCFGNNVAGIGDGVGENAWNGWIDEVRLSAGPASPDWVKAEYDTVNNVSFITVAPLEMLEVTWAENPERAGVTNVAWNAAVVGGQITGLGEGATGGTIKGKFWADGETEPANWTTLEGGLGLNGVFEIVVSCVENTVYNYKLRATDDAGGETDPVSGTFTTPLGLAVAWAEASGRLGVTNILGHGAGVGGSVSCLGSSATVSIEGQFWANGDTEPSEWTTLAAGIAQTGDFSASHSGLSENTLYSYKLRVAGSNGNATEPVSGTFTTSQGLRVAWAGDAGQPGVTNVIWNAAVVGGLVEDLGDMASCTIEGKFWTGETEPSEWTVLGAGGFGLGDFSVSVPNLAENTVYNYKLRATETDGSETPAASGSFTTPVGLAVTWADISGRPGVKAVGALSATVGGSVGCLGDSATCAVEGKFWTGETEPENWTSLGDAISQIGDFSATVPNLAGGTAYSYKLRLVGSNGAATTPVTGTFTTAAGLTIAWSSVTGATGFSQISCDFAKVGGTVSSLGDAKSCIVQYKCWAVGDYEPYDWTTLKEGLGLNAEFLAIVTGLRAGTTYNYQLRALGSDSFATEPVVGTFTTHGTQGEGTGSSETHFYNDGTNAYWVANEFERYLDFTVTGYTGTETLTNFPVLVDVRARDENGFTYDDFYHLGGRDIVFVDEKGHIIPHEIDTWNANGQSLIWVRLPEMVKRTTFTMCYRSPLVNPPADPGNTFEKYIGVWHMNEKGNGIVDVIDSTTNNLVGETHANSLAYSSGRIGGARRVAQQSGTSSTYGNIIVPDHDDIIRTGVGNVFTYSCWSKLADGKPGWAYLVSRKSEDASNGWGVQYHDGNSSSQLRAYGGSTVKNEYELFNVSGYSHTKWAYWTFVFSNQTFHAYLNGNWQSTVTLKHPVANDDTAAYDNLVIGGQEIGTGALNGWVDECRYSKGIRSADWIKAEYDSSNQQQFWNDPAKRFVTKGNLVGKGEETLVPVVVWEQGEGMPNTIIDVSYAYVQVAGTVTFCGSGADTCWIEYQIWADGSEVPTEWTTLLADATPGTVFSIPVFGLKQDMPYNFRIRAVNEVNGERRQTREHSGSFRTNGNVNESAADGELLRVDNRFVHLYRAGEYTFTTPDYVTNIEIIVVGGGGAGGYKIGGGGGGGGVFYSESYSVTTSTTYRITVGRGGHAATDTNTASSAGNGEYSAFALDAVASNPLIRVPGGGGGGSCSTTANIVNGYEGASGGGAGGKGDLSSTGASGGSVVSDGTYGHKGGDGNHFQKTASAGTYAAGGGGGGRSAGLAASSDKYYGGGAGGSGVACSMLGGILYFGAGGGGGYAYFEDSSGYAKPGAGGSGIGGNAADVKNGTLATSGVENTGAGGGGGSMSSIGGSNSTFWQGGDGCDGVVIISYEVHGRDPIAEEPRISMTRCEYDEDSVSAAIDYRMYWAGTQNDLADVYIHYSTVGPEELADSAAGGWVKVAESAIGVGSVVFTPPEVGYTYWVKIVGRKNASSFYHSEETGTFDVPAIRLNGATWTESSTSPDDDHATITYKLYDLNEDTHLYCYWSENEAALAGDELPVGEGVYLIDLGPNTGTNLSASTTFRLPATEGLVRNRTYYIRIASGDGQGMKLFPSKEILELDTAEKPITVLAGASWADNNVATVEFTATVGKLDPAQTEVVVLYSLVEKDVKDKKPDSKESVTVASLGLCSDLALDSAQSSAMFPLWSSNITNYYVRVALATNYISEVEGVVTTNRVIVGDSYSQATMTISVSHAVEQNTLIYIVTANPKVMCYGDAALPLDYTFGGYAGTTTGYGYENRYDFEGAIACEATSDSPSGTYTIGQGTFQLVGGGQEQMYTDEGSGVVSKYQHKLAFSEATYTITNAVFLASVSDISFPYTGDACDMTQLVKTTADVRKSQPVSYLYRVGGAGDWVDAPTITNAGNYAVQFIASAPNHDDVRSTFKVTVEPAPLTATIGDVTVNYTGDTITPAVVTNVTGLVRGDINPLTCEFRDESGEWQGEMPSFTMPGTYKVFFRASAPNHATFVTNCTVTINPWDFKVNMDGATGYGTPIIMGRPEWLINNNLLKMTGVELSNDDTRYGALDAICANGLRLWQNYVLERKDFGKKVVATIMQQGSTVNPNSFVVHFPDIEPLMDTGLRVQYRLDKKLRGERTKSEFDAAEFVQGELSGKYELNIPLGPDDPTGLYVFNIVLTPTNELYTGHSVISSVTTVGVMRVASAMRNTVTAVPWQSMALDSTNEVEVSVSEVVNPNSIAAKDSILAYSAADDTFFKWQNASPGVWEDATTVNDLGTDSAAAATSSFMLGGAFWLVRGAPTTAEGAPNCIYLVGRHSGRDYVVGLTGAVSVPDPIGGTNVVYVGHTLVANPTMFDVDLNELVFVDGEGVTATPAAGDRIVTQNAAGVDVIYFRNAANTQWGRNVKQKVKGRYQDVWTPGGTIPSGTGFWYRRTGEEGELRIKFINVR